MVRRHRSGHTARIWLVFGLIALALFITVVATRPSIPGDGDVLKRLDHVLLWYSLLPRGVAALTCGAALGLSGALLQRILRNPIADPSTLGIASGAQLSLTVATILMPEVVSISREAVALGGAIGAVAIVLGLSWRQGLEPLSLVLSGMVISLIAAALSATIVLTRGDYAMSIYIWGAGSLHQQNWDTVNALLPRLAAGLAVAVILLRPLSVAGMSDETARSLGLGLNAIRLFVISLAVWLAAGVTARVGVIGFIGLAAPALARFTGARTVPQIIFWSVVAGSVVLSITDSAVQLLGSRFADLAPTGAATALFGGPFLIWLLMRIRFVRHAPIACAAGHGKRVAQPLRSLGILLLIVVGCGAMFLILGQGPAGWTFATGEHLNDLLPFRVPRIVSAGTAGAMLGTAGAVLQRLTGNPLASPEVLGVSAGAGVGLAVALMVAPQHPIFLLLGLAAGSAVTLLMILSVTAKSGFGPERLLLTGIGTGAFCMAIVATILSQGDLRSYALLVWMSGSTNNAGPIEAWSGLVSAFMLIPPILLLRRWLDILPLGETTARSVGLRLGTARLVLAVLAALLTAVASFLVGPLSLVGLIAPHLARRLGFLRAVHQLAGSALIGFGITVFADWSARAIAFPYQIPVGLFAALIGGPYLIWLLTRRETINA